LLTRRAAIKNQAIKNQTLLSSRHRRYSLSTLIAITHRPFALVLSSVHRLHFMETEAPITIAFIVNGDEQSAMGYRARAFARHLSEQFDIRLAYREGNKLRALLRFRSFLRRTKPRVSYVFDMSYSGVLGAWLHRLSSGNLLIIETGDAIHELMRSSGHRGAFRLWLTHALEEFSLSAADQIVVRGSFHRDWLKQKGLAADVIQDGVDTAEFTLLDANELRREHGLDEVLTIGLVGSSVWSEKLGMCYGWELIELLRLLPGAPLKGVIIGSGSGIPRLKERCREYGIEDRVLFLGHVPYEELPRYLNMIDVCLSTQTNDLAGQVRTTGKLPLYLATGRYVLASEVGEAALVLKREMLVSYEGVQDRAYPRKLAERVKALLNDPHRRERGAANIRLAKEHFEYAKLAERLGDILRRMLRADSGSRSSAKRPETARDATAIAAGKKVD
jgi:glycosyltransferase involved in cell wall biosynthesis